MSTKNGAKKLLLVQVRDECVIGYVKKRPRPVHAANSRQRIIVIHISSETHKASRLWLAYIRRLHHKP